MTSKQRTIARLVWPAAGLLLVYGLAVALPKINRLHTAQRQLQSRSAASGSAGASVAIDVQLKTVQTKLHDLQKEEQSLVKELAVDPAPQATALTTTQTVRAVTDILTRHHLIVSADGAEERSEIGVLPVYLTPVDLSAVTQNRSRSVARPVRGGNGEPPAKLWRFEIVGQYADVSKMLDTLAASDLPVVPASLSMLEPTVDTTLRRWTFCVWVCE